MKLLLPLTSVLFSFFLISSCNPRTYMYENVELSDMIYADGVSQNDLYVLANSWFVKSFVSRKAVVQFSDKEAGVVVGRFVLISRPEKTSTYALIHMRVGDGKINIRLQGDLKTLENTKKNNKWKKKQIFFHRPTYDEKDQAKNEWDLLVKSMASYLESEIPKMENF